MKITFVAGISVALIRNNFHNIKFDLSELEASTNHRTDLIMSTPWINRIKKEKEIICNKTVAEPWWRLWLLVKYNWVVFLNI